MIVDDLRSHAALGQEPGGDWQTFTDICKPTFPSRLWQFSGIFATCGGQSDKLRKRILSLLNSMKPARACGHT
jgi:hypothetical protein